MARVASVGGSVGWAGLVITLWGLSGCGPGADESGIEEHEQDLGAPVLRVDMGARGGHTDSQGRVWEADRFWSGAPMEGIVDRGGGRRIQGAYNQRVYQTEHYCLSGFGLSVPNGTYAVQLHFAETYWSASGKRLFDVDVEGQKVTNLDVFKEAGGSYRALVKRFDQVRVTDGKLDVRFDTHVNCSEINAVQVFKADASPRVSSSLGVNLISNGNQYATDGYTDGRLDELFQRLKAAGFKNLAVRVIWAVMEPARGEYSASTIAHLNRVLSKADQHGLDVMLDFHTLFNADDQGWQAPEWLATFAQPRAVNGESVPARSLRQIFYTDAVRSAYADMMKAVVRQVGSHASVKRISMLNEPYLNWEEGADNEPYFARTLGELTAALRTVTSKPLGVRFLSSWNPWCDEPRKSIGSTSWQGLDYVAMNQYLLSATEATRVEATVFWRMARRAIAAVHGAGKPFILSEIGMKTGTVEQRARLWDAFMKDRLDEYKPDVVLIWNAQNDGAFFPATPDSFNVLSAPGTVTPYVLEKITPHLR